MLSGLYANKNQVQNPHKLGKEKKLIYFGEGPWIDEDDYEEFQHNGIDCKIVRIALDSQTDKSIWGGYWCGYVKVPKNHPFYSKEGYDIDVSCHHGVTYNEMINEDRWIGFDCAHCFDVVPTITKMMKEKEMSAKYPLYEIASYKTQEYAKQVCRDMADQLNEMLNE